jgi:hypothetical protein
VQNPHSPRGEKGREVTRTTMGIKEVAGRGGKGGEMTQTLYAHMKIIIKKEKKKKNHHGSSLTSIFPACTAAGILAERSKTPS